MKRTWTVTIANLVAVASVAVGTWEGWPWYVSTLVVLASLLFSFLEIYEKRATNPKYLVFVATITALASVGRVVTQGIPGVQPATFFIIMAGFVFGPVTGIAVGVMTAIASNLFLGEGAWTPWQMMAWGLVGFTSGCLGWIRPKLRVRWLIPFGALWGYLFGWIMNTWLLIGAAHASLAAFLVLCANSFVFDTNHALVNAGLLLIAGPLVYREFERFRKRYDLSRVDGNALFK